MLWFDGEWLALGGNDWTGEKGWFRKPDWAVGEYMRVNYFWESEKIINEIRKLQPGIMINNRFGWEGDFIQENAGSMRSVRINHGIPVIVLRIPGDIYRAEKFFL